MKNLQFLKDLDIYFVGIGGISMSGLAKLSLHFGARVSGSDSGCSGEIGILRGLGIKVNSAHLADNISSDIDILVFSGAIREDNPELIRGRELGLKMMERSEFLGKIAECFEKVIAISGTHGKTTTTALLGLIMSYAGLNPTIHIGGESRDFHDNTSIGGHTYLLLEACEYRESFRYLSPYIGVITNIDFDHVDYYQNVEMLYSAFARFASKCASLIIDEKTSFAHPNVSTIGGDWEVKNIEYMGGGYSFNVYYMGEYFHTFRLNCLGLHNVTNALCAIAVAEKLGVAKDTMERAIADFKGVERRYETIATLDGGCRVIVDYAHHPTELRHSIDGLKGVYSRVLYVFQPHTFSRTLGLFDEFRGVLNELENLVLFKTYPAREKYISGGSARDLFDSLDVENKAYIEDIAGLIKVIELNKDKCDCVLILGAGDLADKLKEYYM